MTQFLPHTIDRHGGSPTSLSSGHPQVTTGDIREVLSLFGLNAPSRTALVVRVHRDPEYAEIMLIDDSATATTPGGAILDACDTGLAEPLTVHTHLRGVVWHHQLTDLIARISDSRVAELVEASFSPPTGFPELLHETDEPLFEADYSVVCSDLQALWSLTGDCADALLDDGPPWQVDTGLLSPSLVNDTPNRYELIAELHHFLNTRRTKMTSGDIQTLHDSGAFNIAKWAEVVTDRSVAVLIVNSLAGLTSSPLKMPSVSEVDDSRHRYLRFPDRSSATSEMLISESTRLITAPFLWNDDIEGFEQRVFEGWARSSSGPEIVMLATPSSTSDKKGVAQHVE